MAKVAAWAGAFLLYIWVAGVRNVEEVKRWKRDRKVS
jgi:hypothetical protein